jgi:DNA-binding beta-propeller fold protein YncE
MKNTSRTAGTRMERRALAALAVTACAAASLVPVGAAAMARPVPHRAALARFEIARTGAHRPGGPSEAMRAQLGRMAQRSAARPGGSVVLDGGPGVPLANPKTATVYVPVQCATGFCQQNRPGHVLDVINAATCNVKTTAGCRVIARAAAGKLPLAAALDERTDTVYVADGSGKITVVDGSRCNARVRSGCAKPLAAITTGGFPVAAAFNPKTRTLYVASPAGQVFVIGVAKCNTVTTAGCGKHVKMVNDPLGPDAVAVNAATDTVYAANAGPTGNGDTVSVINGATCNGSTGTGCGHKPPTIRVGVNPFWDAVAQATDTVYVANYNDGTISVINGAACNATVTSGCRHTPPAVTTGAGASFAGIDGAVHTVFAMNQNDDTLSAINTRTCRGSMTSGCPKRAPAQQAAPNQGPAYNPFPSAFALIPQLSSLYLVSVSGASILSVLNPGRCDAIHTSGCRREAPSVPDSEYLITVDPATNTLYAGNLNLPQIDVINGATCHTGDLSGCAPVATIPMKDPQANITAGSIDEATHTLYASDPFSNTTSVINTAACNATHTAGCAKAARTITIGPGPGPPVLDPATRTLYIPYGNAANRVAVVNAATCNAMHTSGCGQVPAVVTVGNGTFDLAVSVKTDTVYAPATGAPAFNGHTVAVINGATCNGANHSGCGHLAATVNVGLAPVGVAVNDRTHTVYVANNTLGDRPGTVSVINAAACNGSRTSGCAGRMPTAPIGRSANVVAVETRADIIYVTNENSATVSVLNGANCRAGMTRGCRRAVTTQAVGSIPIGVGVNQRTRTVYVADLFQAGSMSIFRSRP